MSGAGQTAEADVAGTFGRDAELALFDGMLASPKRPFALLHVSGPPGIGKSHLLAAFTRRCAERARAITLSPGLGSTGDASGLDREMRLAVGADAEQDPWRVLASTSMPTVVFVDDADPVALLRAVGTRLPEHCLLVAASRRLPRYESSDAIALLRHVCRLRLHDLEWEPANAMLAACGVRDDARGPLLALAGGHPLALSIVASVAARSASEAQRALTDALLALVRQEMRDPDDAACLDLASVAQVVREDLLCTLSDQRRGVAQFEWLRGLSFAEVVPDGLLLHEVFRRAILQDLRWRNPTRLASNVRRVREQLIERIWSTSGEGQDQAIEDYVLRGGDVTPSMGALSVKVAAPDGDAARSAVAICVEHERHAAARAVSEWSKSVPGCLHLCVDADQQVHGFLLALPLSVARARAELVADSGVRTLLEATRGSRTVAQDDRAVFVRCWTTRSHQAPGPAAALLLARIVKWQLGTAPLAATYVAFARPCAFDGAIGAIGGELVRNATFLDDGVPHDIYRFDWRLVSPAICLAAFADPGRVATASAGPGPIRRLDRTDFADAVHEALRWYGDADALTASPLLATHVVVSRANGSAVQHERVAALRALLLEAIASLSRTPKRAKLRRAVERGYIEGAATQEEAAELLDLPLSTYRRHLRSGVALVADYLWRRNVEVAGP